MEFIWAKNKKVNDCLVFEINVKKECDALKLCAVDSYQVFFDDVFVCYGPSRVAAGYTRPAILSVAGVDRVTVKVLSYGKPCYSCDYQAPFFGAEIYCGVQIKYSAKNFKCFRQDYRKTNMPRFSRQRGFTEGYNYTVNTVQAVECEDVCSPIVLQERVFPCAYLDIEPRLANKSRFGGFNSVKKAGWEKLPAYAPAEDEFLVEKDFLEKVYNAFSYDYILEVEHTGFFGLDITADEETEVFCVFEEYLNEGKWDFKRNNCNDFIVLKIPKGKTEFLSMEPYAIKYIKIISLKQIELQPYVKTCENNFKKCVQVVGDKKIVDIFNSAENTFRQNAVDIFMDCPGRERAGWLCDSFFMAKAERLFTGNNNIEKDFLYNFIIADCKEIPGKMVPMCFPSEHDDNKYIPNWAMWFVIEIEDYFLRTDDKNFVKLAKPKVYGIIQFFQKYLNEYGLLENLQSWVFLEWSIANDPEYIKGVNFPSNMLYAYMLEKAGRLYNDLKLIEQGQNICKNIIKLSYNGQFFTDNAVRQEGKLVRCDNHISETCQYYALFTGICPDQTFINTIKEQFGPLRKEGCYEYIGKSNAFIGNFLRLFWLFDQGEYDRILNEYVDYFYEMASKTGTLWEKNAPTASCNHGFASAMAVVFLGCLCGYKTVVDGKPILESTKPLANQYKIQVKFNY